MIALDTNVLIYSRDPRDKRKQRIALTLIDEISNGFLVWQVACEYLSASRKLNQFGFYQEDAWADIQAYLGIWKHSTPSWDMLSKAQDLKARYSLSHWDSLIVAHCNSIGVKRLYSEDMGGSDNIDGLEIINPFAE